MWNDIALSIQNGNGYLFIMFFLSFTAFTIAIERFLMLGYSYNLNFKKFLENVRKSLAAEDLDRAKSICKSASRTSLPLIALKAIDTASRDISAVRSVIEEETLDFLPLIERRLAALPALATLLLLIGILGTIEELWSSFYSIGILDTAKKQAILSRGISSSLNYTAIGLISCMIILTLHQTLKSMAFTLNERLYHGITVLTNLLVPTAAPAAVQYYNAPSQEFDHHVSSAPVSTSAPTEKANEKFDDVAVEDIKDEEEII